MLKINKITNLTKYHVYSFFGDAQHLPTTHPTLIEGQVAELIDSVVLANGPLFAAKKNLQGFKNLGGLFQVSRVVGWVERNPP